jgi:hypothetical protein
VTRWRAALLALWIAACGDHEEVITHGPSPFIVNPQAMQIALGQTQRVTVTAPSTPALSVAFHSADSCVALVAPDGTVTGVGPGMTRVDLQITAGTQMMTTAVPVTVAELAVLRLTIQSITTGSPPATVDLDAVRGSITVVAFADPSQYASVEMLILGRIVDMRPVPADGRVALTVDTATRDEAGAPLFPNGKQTLVLRGIRRPAAPGCPAQVGVLQQEMTLANP